VCFISNIGSRPPKSAALFVIVAFFFVAPPRDAVAAVVTIRVTGFVTAGVDQTGLFGSANTNLAGKAFKQVFTVNDATGTKTIAVGKPPNASHIGASATVNPIVAALTIGTGTASYGVRPTSATPNSLISKQSSQMSLYTGSENYSVGKAVGGGSMEDAINFAYPSYVASYNWESGMDYTMGPDNTSQGSFVLAYATSILNPWLQSANGTFKITNITVSGPITPPATPHIFFLNPANGQTSDVTNTIVPVVVGEKIQLFAVPSASAAQPKAWNPAGTVVGGFNQDYVCAHPLPPPNPPCGGPTQADLTGSSTSFYWVTPSSGIATVTYSYTAANGQKGSVEAKFDVTAPAAPLVVSKPDLVGTNEWSPATKDLFMLAKINFTATPPPPSGTYQWIQTGQIDHYTLTALSEGKTQTCVGASTPGIDMGNGQYPTFTGDLAIDTPGIGLEPGYLTITHTFAAQMYFLWKPDVPQSIPVPLGYILHGFTESAKFDHTLGVFPTYPSTNLGGWSNPPKLTWQAGSANFVKSGQFPTWNAQFKALPKDCK
jgi:hypothetical protein